MTTPRRTYVATANGTTAFVIEAGTMCLTPSLFASLLIRSFLISSSTIYTIGYGTVGLCCINVFVFLFALGYLHQGDNWA